MLDKHLQELIEASETFKKVDLLKHKSKCLIYISIILIQKNKYIESKKYINEALSITRSILD